MQSRVQHDVLATAVLYYHWLDYNIAELHHAVGTLPRLSVGWVIGLAAAAATSPLTCGRKDAALFGGVGLLLRIQPI